MFYVAILFSLVFTTNNDIPQSEANLKTETHHPLSTSFVRFMLRGSKLFDSLDARADLSGGCTGATFFRDKEKILSLVRYIMRDDFHGIVHGALAPRRGRIPRTKIIDCARQPSRGKTG